MENALQWLHVSGLLLALALATIIFVRSIKLLINRKHHSVRFGLELILSFTLLYFALGPTLNYLNLSEYIEPIIQIISFFWWISLAFTTNASLNEFIWSKQLVDNDVRRIPKLLTDGIGLLIYAAAIMIVMHYVYDEPVTVILASSGAIAFVIGLAAQPTVQEIFAGLSLNTTKSLRMGDFVEIDGIYGEVYEINWRSVSIKSPNTGSLYIFPNSAVAGKTILNFSEPNDLFKYWIIFYIDFASSPELAISTIAEELENSRYVSRDPKPDFNILGFKTTGIEIRVRFYFEGDDPWWDAQNEVCMAIWSSLRRKGIRLGIERMRLGSGDEFDVNPWTSDKAASPDEKGLELLSKHTLLKDFSANETNELFSKIKRLDFTPPDCLISEGDTEYSYFIVDGNIETYRILIDDKEVLINTYNSGDIVGLESLLNNDHEPKHKVQSKTYTVVYRLDNTELFNLINEHEKTKSALLELIKQQENLYEKNYNEYLDKAKKETHQQKHSELNLHIREHINEFYEKPTLHKILHTLRPRTIEKDLLEAVIAAASLIATARGEIDNIERDFLRQKLGAVELFKHIDLSHSIELFESFSDSLNSNTIGSSTKITAKLNAISKEPILCKITMGIAFSMSKVHEDTTQKELDKIKEIAQILNMPNNLDDLITEIKTN